MKRCILDKTSRSRATLLAMSIAVAACGEPEAPATIDEESGLTNVAPREAVRGPDGPELASTSGQDSETAPALGGSPANTTLAMPDKTLTAAARLEPASGSDVTGAITFRQTQGQVRISGSLQGLEPGEHALHIHEAGDCSAPDASSAGGHFAPDDDRHGAPDNHSAEHHVGDLGNFTADEQGNAVVSASDIEMTLDAGPKSIMDRAVIVHAGADDFASQPAGDAGERVACGVVMSSIGPAY